MLIRTSSISSFSRKQKQKSTSDPKLLLIKNIQSTIQQASCHLSFIQFKQIYQNIIFSCIKKAQNQNAQNIYLPFLKKISTKYMPNLEINTRITLLEVKSQYQMFPQQCINKLNKLKHMIIDSQIEYLLTKVFIMDAKCYQKLGKKHLQEKSLKKAVKFAQNFILEYINQTEQIRSEIIQNIIMSYIELYKINKQSDPQIAEKYLEKAQRTSQKVYGEENQIFQIIDNLHQHHKHVRKSLQKYIEKQRKSTYSSKPVTTIFQAQVQKNMFVNAAYCWQDQKIQVKLTKGKYKNIGSSTEYCVKLDINKINILKDLQANWISLQNDQQIVILEEQLLKNIGIKNQPTTATRIQFRNISRDQIIKKDTLSSSSGDDASFLQKEQFNFIRKLGRAQSAKRQSNR